MLIFTSGCGKTFDKRLIGAAAAKAVAEVPDLLPEYPSDCRVTRDSGAVLGENLRAASLRLKHRLDQQNTQTLACATWFDTLRAGRAQ